MQASLAIPGSPDRSNCYFSGESNEFSGRLSEYFSRKLQLREHRISGEEEEKPENEPDEYDEVDEDDDEEEEEEEEEEEFSFACSNPDGSPISAEEVFQDGQIRPIFPIFDRSLLFGDGDGGDSSNARASTSSLRPPLKKLFVEQRDASASASFSSSEETDGAPVGPYCEWTRKKVVEATPGTCKKSNSTGFSKLWRFRDLVLRSNSDGKDAFVFLSSPPASSKNKEKAPKKKEKKEKSTTASEKVKKKKKRPSAHEMHYVQNRAMREEHKRRSYLPYRQGVVGVGFFTTVNGLTRNVSPF